MANEKQFEVGVLVAEKKVFTDRETGVSREYYSYSVMFENGAVVRFAPLQQDRSLLNFAMALGE